jgi:hypothetical protein
MLPDWRLAREWRAEANAVLAAAHEAVLARRPVEFAVAWTTAGQMS